jgi:hypothetical protein
MKAADRNYIAYYQDLMEEMRRAIADGCFDDFSMQRKRLGKTARHAVSLSLISNAFSPNSEAADRFWSFRWSRRKSFCKNGTRGGAAFIRAWKLLAKG